MKNREWCRFNAPQKPVTDGLIERIQKLCDAPHERLDVVALNEERTHPNGEKWVATFLNVRAPWGRALSRTEVAHIRASIMSHDIEPW